MKTEELKNISVLNTKGEKVENIKLNEKVFTGEINQPLLYQTLNMYLANKRQGSASTKDRSEVSGGGRKPWRQKGTGRARVGSIRSPLWRGGGVIFGPKPKDWHYDLPKKLKKKALISSLNAKIKEENLVVIDEIKLDAHKTKLLSDILVSLKLKTKKVLIIDNKEDKNLRLASCNIPNTHLVRLQDINAYEILSADTIIIAKEAFQVLEKDLVKVV
ncbi:MAG: 50S ribosomal protein L4 [Candidatus Omnitrophota bacterium]